MEFGITLNVMGSHVSAFSRGMMRFVSYFNKITLETLAGSLYEVQGWKKSFHFGTIQ